MNNSVFFIFYVSLAYYLNCHSLRNLNYLFLLYIRLIFIFDSHQKINGYFLTTLKVMKNTYLLEFIWLYRINAYIN